MASDHVPHEGSSRGRVELHMPRAARERVLAVDDRAVRGRGAPLLPCAAR